MSWTTPADLRAQVHRLWDKGDLLRSAIGDEFPWPKRLTLKVPTAGDLSDRFDAVRDWVREFSRTPNLRIDWRESNHRVLGAQQLPAAAWVESLADAVNLIAKRREFERFKALWQWTATRHPALLPWISRRPLQVLELADKWDRLLSVVEWVKANPRPGIYLRQVDAPGVDSKFIETNRTVLSELLDLALPPEAIDTSASGGAQFARRFGFREKPVRIRFRSTDRYMPGLPHTGGMPDVTLDASTFASLELPVRRVFVTENEVNFLSFPEVPGAIVVFGAGYGWEAIARADWLHRCPVHYWGDIDTNGFAILDQLRGVFPHVESLLMDQETLLAHREHWGEEPQPARHELSRLTPEEANLYDELRFDRLQGRLRLEQERIGFAWVLERLAGHHR